MSWCEGFHCTFIVTIRTIWWRDGFYAYIFMQAFPYHSSLYFQLWLQNQGYSNSWLINASVFLKCNFVSVQWCLRSRQLEEMDQAPSSTVGVIFAVSWWDQIEVVGCKLSIVFCYASCCPGNHFEVLEQSEWAHLDLTLFLYPSSAPRCFNLPAEFSYSVSLRENILTWSISPLWTKVIANP